MTSSFTVTSLYTTTLTVTSTLTTTSSSSSSSASQKYNTSSYPQELASFQSWAEAHEISLVGINKNSTYLYHHGYDASTDRVELKSVSGVLIAADALYKIPENVLQVMRGKTLYFSNQPGRSYTVLSSFPEQNILKDVDRGIVLEQQISAYTVIHELGHIVDFHGIQGIYNDRQNIFSGTRELRDKIFSVNMTYDPSLKMPPPGYLSVYSTANDAENFAEHFAFYVLFSDEFRQKMQNDSLLIQKYVFLLEQIFNGKTY